MPQNLSTGAIIGITITAAVIILIFSVIIVIVCWIKSMKRYHEAKKQVKKGKIININVHITVQNVIS